MVQSKLKTFKGYNMLMKMKIKFYETKEGPRATKKKILKIARFFERILALHMTVTRTITISNKYEFLINFKNSIKNNLCR